MTKPIFAPWIAWTVAPERLSARALIQSFEADLGRDPSAADLLAVRHAAMLTAIAEDAAARQLAGDAKDPSTLIPLVNAARRAVLDLGRNAQSEHSRLRFDKLQEGNFEETAERVRSIDEMDMASKITQLFKRARESPFPSLVARAEQVRELLETARRRSDAKRPIQQKKAVDKLD